MMKKKNSNNCFCFNMAVKLTVTHEPTNVAEKEKRWKSNWKFGVKVSIAMRTKLCAGVIFNHWEKMLPLVFLRFYVNMVETYLHFKYCLPSYFSVTCSEFVQIIFSSRFDVAFLSLRPGFCKFNLCVDDSNSTSVTPAEANIGCSGQNSKFHPLHIFSVSHCSHDSSFKGCNSGKINSRFLCKQSLFKIPFSGFQCNLKQKTSIFASCMVRL